MSNNAESPTSSGGAAGSPVLGTGFYRDTKPGTFGRSEWLDLLMAVQDGRATCMRGLEIIEREMDLISNPPKHVYWGAGELDCPTDIKAPNGELHTLKCKVCGLENPRGSACCAHLANSVVSANSVCSLTPETPRKDKPNQ